MLGVLQMISFEPWATTRATTRAIMLKHVDWRQVKALAKSGLTTEWRMTSRKTRAGKSGKGGWAYLSVALYVLLGLFLSRFFRHDATPAELLTNCTGLVLYLAMVTASNIFMSFGAGFLNPEELNLISPLPVTSETFFTSRLLILLIYSSIIAISIGLVPVIVIPVVQHCPWYSAFGIMAGLWLSTLTAALAIIVVYGLFLSRIETKRRSRLMSYAQFLGTFITTGSIVILPRIAEHWNPNQFAFGDNPWILGLPATWFASLMLLLGGFHETHPYLLAPFAILFAVVMGVLAFRLLGSHYQAGVQELIESTRADAKRDKGLDQHRSFFSLPNSLPFLRIPESRAIWTIFRAQYRFDTKFRLSLLSVLPITILYLVMAIVQGGVKDPFIDGMRGSANATMLYIFALLSPLFILQAISQTEQFKASWIFFSAPVDRALLLIAARNTLLLLVVLPYMIVLFIAFAIFIPIMHALMHIAIIASIAMLMFQLYLMVRPRMPFAQQRQPNKTNYVVVLAGYGFAAVALGLLATIIYFGYRDSVRYFISLSLLIALTLLMERFLRTRLRSKLEEEEFEG